jgi:nitroreductase
VENSKRTPIRDHCDPVKQSSKEFDMTQATRTYEITAKVGDPASVETAIRSRASIRAFLDRPVPREVIEELLTLASQAPSGVNTQPWRVYVLQGEARAELVRQVCEAHDAFAADPSLAQKFPEDYDYYPSEWVSPYLDRRRENGWALYATLGIVKGEKEKMHRQHQRNYHFFDAPVGLMFTLDRRLGRGSLLDYGMFLQTFMIAARAKGLHTCPQAAWNGFAHVVKPLIGASADEMLVCGMSLGYADDGEAANGFRATRVPVSEFTTWL